MIIQANTDRIVDVLELAKTLHPAILVAGEAIKGALAKIDVLILGLDGYRRADFIFEAAADHGTSSCLVLAYCECGTTVIRPAKRVLHAAESETAGCIDKEIVGKA